MSAHVGSQPVVAAEPLSEIPFALGPDWLFSEARNDGLYGGEGRWELVEGRLTGDFLRLKLRFEPPPYMLPVEAGPAALFGGLHLWGDAGGDVGASEWVDSLAMVNLEPCSDATCVTVATIDIPTRDLRPAINRLERQARLMWVSAELTLVRTFAGGTWLQVIPFQHRGDGAIGSVTGTLGAIKPTVGPLFRYGLFPAEEATPLGPDPHMFRDGFDYRRVMEEIRRSVGDQTQPMLTAPVRLTATIEPPCEGSPALTLHDEGGAWFFETKLHQVAKVDQTILVPTDVDWWLALHDGGGIEFERINGWGVRLGPVAASGGQTAVDATLDCSVPDGVLRLDGAVVDGAPPPPHVTPAIIATATPSAAPSAATTSTRLPSPESAPAFPIFVAVIVLVLAAVLVGLAFRSRRT